MVESELYQDKNTSYFNWSRHEMLKYIPTQALKILDVGCGNGNFAALIKKERNVEIWGVELNQEPAAIAATKLDRVICAAFSEHLDLPKKEFDCLIFNDVLEHMVDPYSALLYSKELLKDGGVVVASIPNVRYLENLYKLVIEGDWKYTEFGILDRTHLRFFTKKSIIDTFKELGFGIEKIEGINSFDEIIDPLKDKPRQQMLFRLSINIIKTILPIPIEDVRYQQFAIVASPQV